MKIDLNSDLGESFGAWRKGHDGEILKIVTSANIACGFHAGDPAEMRRTCRTCVSNDVGIGAHPGFRDLAGFGRNEIFGLSGEELKSMIVYQIGALRAIAAAEGGKLRHVKMHGALANMASRDDRLADTVVAAVLEAGRELTIMTIAATCLQRAAERLEAKFVAEVFADRAYEDDGTLVPRCRPDAMIREPETCADHVLKMVESGAITSINGKRIPIVPKTVCVHGDTKGAVAIAAAVRERLDAAGISVERFQ